MQLIGQVSLHWTDATAGAGAKCVSSSTRRYRRQGYAHRSGARRARPRLRRLPLPSRFLPAAAGQNQASAKLLKELGMRLEAHYREHALFQGEWDEELHFAILDREWQRGSKVRELHRAHGRLIACA